MLTFAVACFSIAALGTVVLAAKYLTGPVPADYHAEILRLGGVEAEGAVTTVLHAVYRVIGSLLLALASGVVLVSIAGVWADIFWAKVAVLTMILIAAGGGAQAAWALKEETGVQTPWSAAIGLGGLGVLGFVLSLF